jgi:hypothetical protein
MFTNSIKFKDGFDQEVIDVSLDRPGQKREFVLGQQRKHVYTHDGEAVLRHIYTKEGLFTSLFYVGDYKETLSGTTVPNWHSHVIWQ